jgi:hypothetical protein
MVLPDFGQLGLERCFVEHFISALTTTISNTLYQLRPSAEKGK